MQIDAKPGSISVLASKSILKFQVFCLFFVTASAHGLGITPPFLQLIKVLLTEYFHFHKKDTKMYVPIYP